METFFLVFVLALALAGGLFFSAGMGLRARMEPREGRLNYWQAFQVRSILTDWRVSVAEEQESVVFRTFYSYLALVWATILIAIGIGFVLAAIVLSGLVLAMLGTLLVKVPSPIQYVVLVVYIVIVTGSVSGLLFAMRQIRSKAAHGVRFGDLSQRRSADYRSPLIHLLALPTFLLITLSTILLGLSLGPVALRVQALSSVLFMPGWTLWIIPALMLAIVALIEGLIARIARFPRFLLTLAPEMARRYDDMLRAIFAGWLLTSEFLAIGCLAWAQYGLINLILIALHSTPSGALSALLGLSYISVIPLLLVASLVSARHGRLGGRISRQICRVQLGGAS
ncbi:MAG TPA: hypothetical protein VKV20_04660 [Ktedonobacteraceae bacterium]|nr:hypothetical protein [Ktedonobacteraceae bacterium]